MGKIIQLGEHLWTPPPEPTIITDVLFAKEAKHNQYWRRAEFPKFFTKWDHQTKMYADHTLETEDGNGFISLNRSDTKRFIELRDQEMRRRRDGVWFMNNGELTYMAGGHYFMLQWCHLQNFINPKDGTAYGDYMEYQAHLFYWLLLCKQDKDCLGTYILKPKKTGVTQALACDFLDESTRMKSRWFGMMSKNQVECRDNNFGMYKLAFENMPNVFKPIIANENLTNIFFANPINQKAARSKKGVNLPDTFLNTRVAVLPTKDDAFDGNKPFRAWTDELPKYIDPYPDMVSKKTSAAVKMQEEITGKWWISSYTPEDDSTSKKMAEKVYYESKLRTRDNKTNRTTSELYAYFISVLDAAKGSFDIYGKADRRKNQIFIDARREKLKNDKQALQAEYRVNPITEDEAWRAGGGSGSTFDNLRLAARKFVLEENQRVGSYPFIEANLEWTDERKNRVAIVPITEDDRLKGKEGLWRFYEMDKWRKEALNEFVTKDLRDASGNWMPSSNVRFIGSMDPTNYSLGNLVLQKSKNSMWIFSLPDSDMNAAFNKNCTGRHVAEYLHRHDRPSETLEDLKKAIFLFGSPFAIEGNMSWAITRLIEDGLQNFVLVIDSKTKAIVPYNPLQHQSMLTTQRSANSASVDGYVRTTAEYLGAPTIVDEPDNLENIDSVTVLEQLMDFNPLDTREFDHAMGFMVAVQAMYNYMAYLSKRGVRTAYGDKAAMEKAVSILMG